MPSSATFPSLAAALAAAGDDSVWSPMHSSDKTIIGHHRSNIPYLPSASKLQTLSVWVPPHHGSQPEAAIEHALAHDAALGTWIIYIHGGAWRDPRIDAESFSRCAEGVLRQLSNTTNKPKTKLAGLISLSYRLSPYPASSSSEPDPSTRADPSRTATHPSHISDVLAALSFLSRTVPSMRQGGYVLAGHSCGATLAFQSVMHPAARWGLEEEEEKVPAGGPRAVVGLNGLYDLSGFIAAPPGSHAHLREGYREFVAGAFGASEETWREVGPATATGAKDWVVEEWAVEKGRKKMAVLVQSTEDTLVPVEQLVSMRERLGRSGEGEVVVREMVEGGMGDHNEVWERGEGRMAEILWEVVNGLDE